MTLVPVTLNILWYCLLEKEGIDLSSNFMEFLNSKARLGQAYYIYSFPGPDRVAVYRLTSELGQPFAYGRTISRGIRHKEHTLLGYASAIQKPGMVPLVFPRLTLNRIDDSRYQSDFQDFELHDLYAYPADTFWDGPPWPNLPANGDDAGWARLAEAFSVPIGHVLEYSSLTYKHRIELHKAAPGINKWTITNPITGLDLQFIWAEADMLGGSTVFWNDFAGWEGGDNAPCRTLHNPTPTGNPPVALLFRDLHTPDVNVHGVYEDVVAKLDFVDMKVIPNHYLSRPLLAVPPTGPAPCDTEYHGENEQRLALYEDIKCRFRIDLDWLGREGVHKCISSVFFPEDVICEELTPGSGGAIGIHAAGIGGYAIYSDGYAYDPIHHAAPIHLNAFPFPAMMPGDPSCVPPAPAKSFNMFDPLHDFLMEPGVAVSVIGRQEIFIPGEGCPICIRSVNHAWAGDPAVEPQFASGIASIFLKSIFPAGAAGDQFFGVGLAINLTKQPKPSPVSTNVIVYSNPNSVTCFFDSPAEAFKTGPGQALTQGTGVVYLASTTPGPHIHPAGTFTHEYFVITDILANFKGHVDWLVAQGLI